MQFAVSLIRVTDLAVTTEQAMELARNCTPVTGRYWIFEGDPEFLNAPFEVVANGITEGGLGDKSEGELIQEVEDVFGVTLTVGQILETRSY